MKIYYGYDINHYLDITDNVFNNCLKDDGIFIPKDDNKRALLFTDPYPGTLKHIRIIDTNNNIHIFTHTMDIHIKINSISKQLTEQTDPRYWWNSVGKYLSNPIDKVNGIHNNIIFNYGNIKDEFPEQVMAMTYINENDKVLEIGGNIGRNTIIINMIINNPHNLVTLESDINISKQLQFNLNINRLSSYVEPSALSERRLIQKDWVSKPLDVSEIPDGWSEINTITYDNLIKKYNINFNTIVADCEGALFYILKDNPNILNNINTVIMENDYNDITHKEFVDSVLIMKGLKRVYYEAGGWGPCYSFFFEVWKRE